MNEYNKITSGAVGGLKLPSVAMKIGTEFIENKIEGYRTLTVSGRETISNIIEVQDLKRGVKVRERKLPSRTLTIQYQLKAEDSLSFQKAFKELRKVLAGEELEISFRDEPEAFYFGELETMNTIPPYSNSIVSEFTILCPEPYIYGKEVITSGEVTIDTFYFTRPELIRITTDKAVNGLTVSNGEQEIRLTKKDAILGSGDVVEINVKENELLVNGEDKIYMVAMDSDYGNFEIKQGQTLTTDGGTIELVQREVWL